MSISIENLKELQNQYRKNGESDEFISLLNEIKLNPLLIFNNSISRPNDILLILLNTINHTESIINNDTFIIIKSLILDIFSETVNYPEIAWFINESNEIVSTLFYELSHQNDTHSIVKVLNCLVKFLDFDRNEIICFGLCGKSCCRSQYNKRIKNKMVLSTCQNVVKLCLKQVRPEDVDVMSQCLIVLNLIFRQLHIKLSPESCGDLNTYKSFKHFLLTSFESKNLSSVCSINILSCFSHCIDSNSDKCLNERNGKYTMSLIYGIFLKHDVIDDFSSCIHTIFLLNDMLQQPNLVDIIRRHWDINNFKTICKRFMDENPPIYYEIILNFFITLKDAIPEWGNCLHRILHTNSKVFHFVLKLTLHNSDRCSIMAWRLLKTYFMPSEIPELFNHEYLSTIINSIKYNLEKAFFSNNYINYPGVLIGRKYLKTVKRCQQSIDFLLMLLNNDVLSDILINICVNSKILPLTVALSMDILKEEHSGFLSLNAYTIENLNAALFCTSKAWLVSGANLVISLMFINVSMSQLCPDLICIRSFEDIIIHKTFTRLLSISMSHGIDDGVIERSLAVISYCSRLSNYDISSLSQLIQVNNVFLSCLTSSLTDSTDNVIIDDNLSTMMKTRAFINESNNSRHQENINKIINVWLNGKKDFKISETVDIFEDYIISLKDQQRLLEKSISEKDQYIILCNDNVNELRNNARNNDFTMQRLITNIRSLNENVEEKETAINVMIQRTKDFERKLSAAESVNEKNSLEIIDLKECLKESNGALARVSKEFESSEDMISQLKLLLTKSESENKAKETEIKRLSDITETIESLFHRR